MPDAVPEWLDGPAGTKRLRIRGGERSVLHQLKLPEGRTCDLLDGGILRVAAVKAGDRIELLSWCGPTAAEVPAAEWMAGWKPVPAAGFAPQLGEETTVAGRLNADPEAAGTAYEIDDVPLPGGPHAMTLSGLAFDKDGTAYACTLVGDVWRIRGLHGDLREVRWKRVAAGLDLPMGIEVVDGVPVVNARHHLLRLFDSNSDGVTDRHEAVNRVPLGNRSECGRDLRRDAAGNFIFNSPGGIHRLSADGTKFERIGGGARNPLGLAVRGDGLAAMLRSDGWQVAQRSVQQMPRSANAT
jgi:glucose/arabinose dehydrogenase